MDYETLMKRIADVDVLLEKNLITSDKADDIKQRLVRSYEESEIPERRLPNDMAHLPGRMIEGMINLGKAIVKGSGETYRHLEEQERKADKKGKNVIELYKDSL